MPTEVGGRKLPELLKPCCVLRPRTIFTECINSLIRNVVKKGLMAELRKRNTANDSLSANNHFSPRQPLQFACRRTAIKYGMIEIIRKSKMRNEVVAIFRSLCAVFNRLLSRSVGLLGMDRLFLFNFILVISAVGISVPSIF